MLASWPALLLSGALVAGPSGSDDAGFFARPGATTTMVGLGTAAAGVVVGAGGRVGATVGSADDARLATLVDAYVRSGTVEAGRAVADERDRLGDAAERRQIAAVQLGVVATGASLLVVGWAVALAGGFALTADAP